MYYNNTLMPFIALELSPTFTPYLHFRLIFYLCSQIGSLGTKDSDVSRDKQAWKSYGWPKFIKMLQLS